MESPNDRDGANPSPGADGGAHILAQQTTSPPVGPRPLAPPRPTGDATLDALAELLAIVARLRAPQGGCPWDLEQTTISLAPSLVEEAHELVDALEVGDVRDAIEEAGDLLMAHFLLCQIAADEGRFDVTRVARAVSEKLIRRHPHVFGEGHSESADAVLSQWERIKKQERELRRAQGREREDTSALAGVPTGLPALQRAQRVGSKAISAGFRWGDARGALAKVREELAELEAAFERAESSNGAADREALARELGDVLFATAQLGNYVGIDPEAVAREAARRFERRFRTMEVDLDGRFEGRELAEMMAAWERAKRGTATV